MSFLWLPDARGENHNIFISYMNGDTMQSIANQLQLKGIPYSETSGIWSKHMVRRIL
ncbi:MAG: recombinase family protein [Ruthenibacterium lactatiformans]